MLCNQKVHPRLPVLNYSGRFKIEIVHTLLKCLESSVRNLKAHFENLLNTLPFLQNINKHIHRSKVMRKGSSTITTTKFFLLFLIF